MVLHLCIFVFVQKNHSIKPRCSNYFLCSIIFHLPQQNSLNLSQANSSNLFDEKLLYGELFQLIQAGGNTLISNRARHQPYDMFSKGGNRSLELLFQIHRERMCGKNRALHKECFLNALWPKTRGNGSHEKAEEFNFPYTLFRPVEVT